MRVLSVHPGPGWSVADVWAGWTKAFRQLGCQVIEFDTDARFDFYDRCGFDEPGGFRPAFDTHEDALTAVAKGLESVCYEVWPDIVFVPYAHWIPPETLQLLRTRGHTVIVAHTEAPYEDDRYLRWAEAGVADLWLVNDPTNMDRWRKAWPAVTYVPHSYDPDIHRPLHMRVTYDVCFVGSAFPSRVEWFSRFRESAPDLELLLAGNWMSVPDDHPLAQCCPHTFRRCLDNAQVPPLYAASKVGLNLYRREHDPGSHAEGWAMGPREVEMAACGLFFLTEARGENRSVLPMLPIFDGPDDAAEQAAWWADHPVERQDRAEKARQAVASWTFEHRARQVLQLVERLDTAA